MIDCYIYSISCFFSISNKKNENFFFYKEKMYYFCTLFDKLEFVFYTYLEHIKNQIFNQKKSQI